MALDPDCNGAMTLDRLFSRFAPESELHESHGVPTLCAVGTAKVLMAAVFTHDPVVRPENLEQACGESLVGLLGVTDPRQATLHGSLKLLHAERFVVELTLDHRQVDWIKYPALGKVDKHIEALP